MLYKHYSITVRKERVPILQWIWYKWSKINVAGDLQHPLTYCMRTPTDGKGGVRNIALSAHYFGNPQVPDPPQLLTSPQEAISSDFKRAASQQAAALCKRGTDHDQERHTPPHGKLGGWPNLLPHSNKLFYSLPDFMRPCGTKSPFNDRSQL
jgi:hypothetical protein